MDSRRNSTQHHSQHHPAQPEKAEPAPESCSKCGSTDVERHYGGDRGEAGPYLLCGDCGFDEETGATSSAEPAPDFNPWRSIDDAPRDHIIEGRFSPDEEVGRPVRWRNSRRRVGTRWVDGGVWHAAETAGAVELHPTEWREWQQVGLRFDSNKEVAA